MASVCCCFDPRLRVFERGMLGKILGSKRLEKDCVMSCTVDTPH
jgi:hypothetical protein